MERVIHTIEHCVRKSASVSARSFQAPEFRTKRGDQFLLQVITDVADLDATLLVNELLQRRIQTQVFVDISRRTVSCYTLLENRTKVWLRTGATTLIWIGVLLLTCHGFVRLSGN